MTMLAGLGIYPGASYRFEYTNHRGETETRTADFVDCQYGCDGVYYTEPQLMFFMFDLSRGAHRSFAVAKINFDTWRKL